MSAEVSAASSTKTPAADGDARLDGDSDGAGVPAFCTRCGRAPSVGDHSACQRWLASEEPPRYCAACGRRMKVQVVPTGWAAECSRHGRLTGGTWA